MRGLIGKKIGMTQIFSDEGTVFPVTIVEAGPCVVTQIKTEKNDGYSAVQLGFGDRKEKHTNKPMKGLFEKANTSPKRVHRYTESDAGQGAPDPRLPRGPARQGEPGGPAAERQGQ